MKKGLVTCYVHGGDPFPAELCHVHHKQPRSACGTDHPSNLCHLCPTCHNAVDRGATLSSKGKNGHVVNMVQQYLPSHLDAQNRLLDLIRIQAQSWVVGDKTTTRKIIVSLPLETYNHLKILANSRVNPKTKRPMGIAPYISEILTSFITSKIYKK